MVLPLLGDIGLSIAFVFFGIYITGPDKNKAKNSIHAAKYLNAYYAKHSNDIESVLRSYGYFIKWEIKYNIESKEQIHFEGGRNNRVRNKSISSTGYFEVAKISINDNLPTVNLNAPLIPVNNVVPPPIITAP